MESVVRKRSRFPPECRVLAFPDERVIRHAEPHPVRFPTDSWTSYVVRLSSAGAFRIRSASLAMKPNRPPNLLSMSAVLSHNPFFHRIVCGHPICTAGKLTGPGSLPSRSQGQASSDYFPASHPSTLIRIRALSVSVSRSVSVSLQRNGARGVQSATIFHRSGQTQHEKPGGCHFHRTRSLWLSPAILQRR